jgi:L-fuculose-phosphate aldolase
MPSPTPEMFVPPRERLVAWLSRLYNHRFTTTTGGNLSFIDDDGMLYITPSGGDKALVPPSDVAVCKSGGDLFEMSDTAAAKGGGGTPAAVPSMEWRLHTSAYKVRPDDCKAVLHAHSTALVAFSLAVDNATTTKRFFGSSCDTRENDAGVPDTRCLLSAWMACGRVAFTPYRPPGSDELASVCADMFSKHADCVILQNHGVVTIGSSLREAYDRFVTLEFLAQTIVNALPIGIPRPLKKKVLDWRKQAIASSGDSSYLDGHNFLGEIPICTNTGCDFRTVTGAEKELRAEICRFVQRAYDHNLFTSSSGSISARADGMATNMNGAFLITPTNVDRLHLSSADICYIVNYLAAFQGAGCAERVKDSINRQPLAVCHTNHTNTRPTHTSVIHNTIYNAHPDVNCIIMTQPLYATAFCITGHPLNAAGIPESHLVLGDVQTLPFESLENDGVAISNALDLASGKSTVFINGFGLITAASSLLKAYVQVEVCESFCGIMLTAMRRGAPVLLSNDEVKEIDVLFDKGH